MLTTITVIAVATAPIDVQYHGPKEPGAAPLGAFNPPEWNPGDTSFIAVNETNLRKSAVEDAESLAILALASHVRIVSRATDKVKVGYRGDYWYEVETDGGARGFVFGGALTPAGLTTDFDDDGTPESATVAWSPDYKVRLRFLKGGVVKQLDLRPGGQAYACCGGRIHVELIDKAKAGLTLLQISSDAEACGDFSIALVSFVDGEPRVAVESSGLIDPPNYSEVEFIYAPKKQQVTLQRKVWSDDDGGEKAAEKRREVFRLKDGVFRSVKTGKSTGS